MLRLILLIFFLIGCSTQKFSVSNSGFYEKDGKRSFVIKVNPGVKDADYTFLRTAYELCKKSHRGVDVVTKSLMQPPGGASWVEGKINCKGPLDKSLNRLYREAVDTFVSKKSEDGWVFELVSPLGSR